MPAAAHAIDQLLPVNKCNIIQRQQTIAHLQARGTGRPLRPSSASTGSTCGRHGLIGVRRVRLRLTLHHRSNNDDLFITGMFSLLDVILDMPMSEVLDNMLLPEEVREALQNAVACSVRCYN